MDYGLSPRPPAFLSAAPGGGFVVCLSVVGFVDEVAPLFAAADHPVDGAPVGEASQVTVVDEEVGLQFTGEMGVVVGALLGIVAVGGVELDAAFAAPGEGIFQELSLAAGPEYKAVTVGNEHLECLDGEGTLATYLGIFVLDDRAVEIYGY